MKNPTSKEEIFSTLKNDGIVSTELYEAELFAKLKDKELVDPIIDSLQREMKRIGAETIDDYVYVCCPVRDDTVIKQEIQQCFLEIKKLFEKLRKIRKATKITVTPSELEKKMWFSMVRSSGVYMGHLLVALCSIGLVPDESAYDLIASSDFSKEVDHAKRYYRISMENYIKLRYKEITEGAR